ncbi:MAG: phage tail sheath subtilisin-like domain-containing protein [Scytonematopsis contorta HA4267-MV1]|jgi:hypothetical protein|nr:phage tail sheath subtilisin-like domain-containing protein [Scytonematopsis contorta HA4267-MV1]
MARLDYFAPGVYVEEINRGSRPIEGVSMSVAGFLGFTEDIRGDAELFRPMLVTDWSQYLQYFGKPGSDGFTTFGAYLPYAVRGWFENGGGRCWIVSIGTQLPYEDGQKVPEDKTAITSVNTPGKLLSFKLSLKENQSSQGRLTVLIENDEPIPSSNTNEEPFDTGEFFKIKVIRPDGEPVVFRNITMDPKENNRDGNYIGRAVSQPQNGENTTTLLSDLVNIEIEPQQGSFALSWRPANGRYDIKPPRENYPKSLLYQKVYGSPKNRTGMKGLFEIDDVAMIACPDLMLAYEKRIISAEQLKFLMEMMVTGCENSAPSPPYKMVVLDAPPVKRANQFFEDTNERGERVSPQQHSPQDVEEWLDYLGRRSQFAALYYPWVQVINPKNSEPVFVPPCGHMMGIWCQTDETRGIYKAPANIVPRGIGGLAYDVNFREQELLNPKGINCIRKFRDRGTLVWGARTLADPKNDIDWRYISVRRLMSYISKSIEQGTQWAVFEPNDQDLWARVKRTVTNFLERLWREGALFGATAEEAFYVKCDAELNRPETMRLGQLIVEVGVCPVRPAEFVIFRISQWNGQNE